MNEEKISAGGRQSSNEPSPVAVAARAPTAASGVRRAGHWLLHELYEILPPTIYFLSASI
jgi:hypothetical protein